MTDYEQYRINAFTIDRLSEMVKLLRCQNKHKAGLMMPGVFQAIQDFSGYLAQCGRERAGLMEQVKLYCSEILKAMEAEDDLLTADLTEGLVRDVFSSFQDQVLAKWPEQFTAAEQDVAEMTGGLYTLEVSASGFYTLKHNGEKPFYLHGNGNPVAEARNWVSSEFDPQKRVYAVWGVGLGYHVEQLYRVSEGAVKILVFDREETSFRIAKKYGTLSSIPEEKVSYVHDPTGELFFRQASEEGTGLLLHYPSIRAIETEAVQEIFYKLWVQDASVKQNAGLLQINFYHNCSNCAHKARELFEQIAGQTVVVVAAGPSLDQNLQVLQEACAKKHDFLVMVVGTSFRKLLAAGIRPDFVVFMDAQPRTFAQLDGLTEETVPLIVDSTAYWRIADEYAGESYLACQQGFSLAEELADDNGYHLFRTGGSVTTLALDISISGGASRVICIGMDMAYTGDVSHARNTMDEHDTKNEKTILTQGYYGGEVKTTHLFNIYRSWIEHRIAECEGIEFINATEGGALVHGMKNQTLREALAE